MSFRFIELAEIDSTTAYIKRNPQLWEENYLLVFTCHQTAGRGQNERVWLSQKDKDLAFSFVFHPHISVLTKHIPGLTMYVGLAVLRVLKNFTGVGLQIKWPNDIQYPCNSGVNKKLAGILCELVIENGKPIVFVGVGVNVNSNCFDTQIASKAISIKMLTKKETEIKQLLLALCSEIKLILANFIPPMSQKLLKEISDSFSLLGKKIVCFDHKKNEMNVEILGIDPFGLLMVRDLVSQERYKIDHDMRAQNPD